MGEFEFSKVCGNLHVGKVFGNLENSPWYEDVVYPAPSPAEYKRRHDALRAALRERDLDCLIVGGSCNLMSMWGGVVWLSGHMDFRAVANYVVFPAKGEPTLLFPMAGTHIFAIRKQASGLKDVRSVMGAGGFGKAIVARIKELGLESGNIGIASINMESWGGEFIPVNYYQDMTEGLPKAAITLVPDIFHKLWYRKSAEELEFVRKAGALADRMLEAVAERAKPGVTERQLSASANFAVSDGGGYPHFCIIGSTPMRNPAQIFGNPNPSDRVLQEGDIINNEMAAGYGG
ncbi:MAG: M24 family metallopeptidase, partial [bacterium]|nr:M24 family metallopeptidase [bacterium]